MARCQRHELLAPAAQERIRVDDERASMQLDEGGEGGVDLVFAARFQHMKLQPLRARCFLHVSYDALGSRIVGFISRAITLARGSSSDSSASRFAVSSSAIKLTPRKVAARPREAGDQPVPDRVGATPEDDRDRRGRVFRGECRRRAARDVDPENFQGLIRPRIGSRSQTRSRRQTTRRRSLATQALRAGGARLDFPGRRIHRAVHAA